MSIKKTSLLSGTVGYDRSPPPPNYGMISANQPTTMPHHIHHGVHAITHSDFYYKIPDMSDPRMIEVSWIIETESGKQFGTSYGYNADRYVISAMKKSIDGFISATPVYRQELFSLTLWERYNQERHYGFKQAGIKVPDPNHETTIYNGPALTVQELAHAA